MKEIFSFEELDVWKASVAFADSVLEVIENLNSYRKHFGLIDQMERAVTSVALNIAEGKGRNTDKEYMQFLYYSRGSLFECLTLLEIFNNRGWVNNHEYLAIKEEATTIAKMINSLIRYLKNNRP